MKCKVIKKFYDPFKRERVYPGEFIEVQECHLEGYKPYVEVAVKEEPELEEKVIKKAKKKSGDK